MYKTDHVNLVSSKPCITQSGIISDYRVSYFAYQDQLKKQPRGLPTTVQNENIQEAPQDAAQKNKHLESKSINKNEEKKYQQNECLLHMCIIWLKLKEKIILHIVSRAKRSLIKISIIFTQHYQISM